LKFPTLPHALAATAAGTRLMHVSSDGVFSGTAPSYRIYDVWEGSGCGAPATGAL
jgi:dTDP-4-dehydrorhamnose reductase